jgi:SAM-dependent methyltransferase
LQRREQDLAKVPGRENYSLRYLRGGRIFSYAHQIDSVLAFEPKTVLEVGIGTGMVTAALRATGIGVTTVDCKAELHPDIVASVANLPLEDNSVDISLCCQVLEHLPFEQFGAAIRELARVAALGVVLSLPDATPHYEVRFRLPFTGLSQWVGTRRYHVPETERQGNWEGSGHYWEIGYPETPLKRIVRVIRDSDLRIARTWRVPENPYHRFFVIRGDAIAPSVTYEQ